MNSQLGAYALALASTEAASIPISKLGSLQLQPGFHAYIGSAHGPGGLRARLAHYLGPSAHSYWHIDYLKVHVTPEEVWYCCGRTSWEPWWAQCLGLQRNVSVPWPDLGRRTACAIHTCSFSGLTLCGLPSPGG
jgi:Uri superfamily endonuclease